MGNTTGGLWELNPKLDWVIAKLKMMDKNEALYADLKTAVVLLEKVEKVLTAVEGCTNNSVTFKLTLTERNALLVEAREVLACDSVKEILEDA